MALTKRFLAALTAAFLWLMTAAAAAETPADYDMSAPQSLQPGHLYAHSALLVDEATGEVLFSKDSKVRMYPASTTKIMTLLLGLESGLPLDAQVTIPSEAGIVAEGSSVVPVLPGDVMSFEDLLYGFMLSSGNDGANAVAVLADGSIEAFVAHMNARAQEMGLEGTHYVNAHGYHDAQHYTTAQDLAILSREAMRNETFRRIVAAPKWTISIRRGGKSVTNEIVSRNSLLQSDQEYYYPDCTGIKTGHHKKAGWCFVGSAERDGRRVICVVLDCDQENDKWYDAARLFEYGFTCYEDVGVEALLRRAWGRFDRVRLANADPADAQGGSLTLDLGSVEGVGTLAVVKGSEASLNDAVERVASGASIEWQRPLEAPVAAGERMGTLRCALEDGTTVEAAVTASRDVAAEPVITQAPTQGVPAATQAAGNGANNGGTAASRARGDMAVVVIGLLVALLICCVFALVAVQRRKARMAMRRKHKRRRGAVQKRRNML